MKHGIVKERTHVTLILSKDIELSAFLTGMWHKRNTKPMTEGFLLGTGRLPLKTQFFWDEKTSSVLICKSHCIKKSSTALSFVNRAAPIWDGYWILCWLFSYQKSLSLEDNSKQIFLKKNSINLSIAIMSNYNTE